jgi:hypothetical protein
LSQIGGANPGGDVLALQDGVPSVRWSPAAGLVPLAAYLDERIELLRHPPAGA